MKNSGVLKSICLKSNRRELAFDPRIAAWKREFPTGRRAGDLGRSSHDGLSFEPASGVYRSYDCEWLRKGECMQKRLQLRRTMKRAESTEIEVLI